VCHEIDTKLSRIADCPLKDVAMAHLRALDGAQYDYVVVGGKAFGIKLNKAELCRGHFRLSCRCKAGLGASGSSRLAGRGGP